MLKRIKQYIDFKGIRVSTFEKSIGMSNASIAKSLKTGGSIGADKLETILKVYKDLNSEWLLTGKGNMIKSKKYSNVVNETLETYANRSSICKLCAEKERTIIAQQKLINKQETIIDTQKEQLEKLKEHTKKSK